MENYYKRLVRGLESENIFKNPEISLKEGHKFRNFQKNSFTLFFYISKNINRK
jgi:hypothetical protein